MSGTIKGVRLIGDAERNHGKSPSGNEKAPKDRNPGAQVEDEKIAHEGLTGRYCSG